jgi:hypothetical protein
VWNSAGNGFCAEVFGAIQRDQHAPAEALEWREDALGFDGLEEQRIERGGWGAVQHQADIGVGWNRGDAKQGLTVRSSAAFFQCALMGQERRASHEEQREGGEADIRRRVSAAPWPCAPVGQTGAHLTQIGDQALQRVHGAIESAFVLRRQTKLSHAMRGREETRRLLQIGLGQAQCRKQADETNTARSHSEPLVSRDFSCRDLP